jgi:hypothetical protein
VFALESGEEGPRYIKNVKKYRDVENVTYNKPFTNFIHGTVQQRSM